MARAYRIHIQPFHHQDVLQHLLSADCSACLLAEVVTVNAMNHKAFTIDEKRAVRADAYRSEAYLAGSQIDQIAIGIQQTESQVIEFGVLCAPTFHA